MRIRLRGPLAHARVPVALGGYRTLSFRGATVTERHPTVKTEFCAGNELFLIGVAKHLSKRVLQRRAGEQPDERLTGLQKDSKQTRRYGCDQHGRHRLHSSHNQTNDEIEVPGGHLVPWDGSDRLLNRVTAKGNDRQPRIRIRGLTWRGRSKSVVARVRPL